MPDSTVLMKALEEPMQLISKTDAQATFRLSQARAMLEVDSKPTMVAVWSLILTTGTDAAVKDSSSSTTLTTPAVKLMQGPSSTTACKF